MGAVRASMRVTYNNAGIQSPIIDAADEPTGSFSRVAGINLCGVWA
nr:hypothetical protein GCM10017611_07090 [Rhodococcus wratislaviensis]